MAMFQISARPRRRCTIASGPINRQRCKNLHLRAKLTQKKTSRRASWRMIDLSNTAKQHFRSQKPPLLLSGESVNFVEADSPKKSSSINKNAWIALPGYSYACRQSTTIRTPSGESSASRKSHTKSASATAHSSRQKRTRLHSLRRLSAFWAQKP